MGAPLQRSRLSKIEMKDSKISLSVSVCACGQVIFPFCAFRVSSYHSKASTSDSDSGRFTSPSGWNCMS